MPTLPVFSIPGLLPITRPLLDTRRQMITLPPFRIQNSLWHGIPSIGPVAPGGTPPVWPLASVVLALGRTFPVGAVASYVMSSAPSEEQGSVIIDDPDTWLMHVPEQPLPLPCGFYFWELRTTDTQGVATVFYAGTQPVTA